MYVTRTLETCVKAATEQFPVLLVTGARQVGKTTILKHLAQDARTYVTLDDPMVLRGQRENQGSQKRSAKTEIAGRIASNRGVYRLWFFRRYSRLSYSRRSL